MASTAPFPKHLPQCVKIRALNPPVTNISKASTICSPVTSVQSVISNVSIPSSASVSNAAPLNVPLPTSLLQICVRMWESTIGPRASTLEKFWDMKFMHSSKRDGILLVLFWDVLIIGLSFWDWIEFCWRYRFWRL